MRAWACLVLCCLLAAGPGWGQERDRPILQMELEADSGIPGQPIILRVTVLTPTWFPEPPEFPSFEIPNVMVRLPSRAAGPTSQRIGAQTWSGVTRAYRIYPMIAGRFRIPSRPVVVTYADSNTREPIRLELATDALVFSGVVPQEAAGLDPFIAAESLTLEQSVDGGTEGLEPGQAVTRIVLARIAGTSPIFLPDLIPPLEGEGLAAYPDEPVVAESENRGVLQGERTERVTYVAQSGGRFDLPAISVRWWDLENDRIETAEVPGLSISVAAPIETAVEWQWPALLAWLAGILLAVAVATAAARPVWRYMAANVPSLQQAQRTSEVYAFAQARAAMRRRDIGATLAAVDAWAGRVSAAEPEDFDLLTGALAALGAEHYGRSGRVARIEPWMSAERALRATRRTLRRRVQSAAGDPLPSLNP